MKKYVKPELFFESFELSQSIAACGIDVNSADEHACAPTATRTLDYALCRNIRKMNRLRRKRIKELAAAFGVERKEVQP